MSKSHFPLNPNRRTDKVSYRVFKLNKYKYRIQLSKERIYNNLKVQNGEHKDYTRMQTILNKYFSIQTIIR